MPYFVGGDVDSFRSLNTTTAGILRDAAFFRNVKDVKVLDGLWPGPSTGKTRSSRLFTGRPGVRVPFLRRLGPGHRRQPFRFRRGSEPQPCVSPLAAEDAITLRQVAMTEDLKTAVIIGGGLIGLEMAEASRGGDSRDDRGDDAEYPARSA